MNEEYNLIVKTTALVMNIVKEYVNVGDTVVDCTMGNGYDSLSLAQMAGCGKGGKLVAMDIQTAALWGTQALLEENGFKELEDNGIRLIRDSHENIDKYVKAGEPSAIVFNLGFLPGHDKKIVTSVRSTIPAIRKAIELVRENGIVSVTTYTGHAEGREEKERLSEMLAALPSKKYHVAHVDMINQKKTAPGVFFITRKKKLV